MDTYINSINLERTLDDVDQMICEGNINYSECELAVKNMKRNKSPGLDGICIEFYQVFWPLIGNVLVRVFNQSFETCQNHIAFSTVSSRMAWPIMAIR